MLPINPKNSVPKKVMSFSFFNFNNLTKPKKGEIKKRRIRYPFCVLSIIILKYLKPHLIYAWLGKVATNFSRISKKSMAIWKRSSMISPPGVSFGLVSSVEGTAK